MNHVGTSGQISDSNRSPSNLNVEGQNMPTANLAEFLNEFKSIFRQLAEQNSMMLSMLTTLVQKLIK